MKIFFLLVSLIMLPACSKQPDDTFQQPDEFVVPEGAKLYAYHGYNHIDPYYWVEEKDTSGDPTPKIQKIIDDENKKSNEFFAQHSILLNEIYTEINTRREKVKKADYIVQDEAFIYTSETRDGESYPVRYATSKETNEKFTLIDEANRAKDLDFYSVTELKVSPEKNRFIWVEDTFGERHGHLYVKDIRTQEVLFSVPNVSASIAWGKDEYSFYYTKLNEDTRSFQIRYVDLTEMSDIEVFTEVDIAFLTYVKRTISGDGVIIGTTNWDVGEVYVVWFSDEPDDLKLVGSRDSQLSMSLQHSNEQFFMRHHKSGEPYKISSFPSTSSFEKATLFYESKFGSILSVKYFKDYIVIGERENGVDKLLKYSFKDEKFTEIDVGLEFYGLSFYNLEQRPETNVLRVSIESHLVRRTEYNIDLEDDSKTVLSERGAHEFNKDNYVAEIIEVKSHDGVMVPATIIRRADLVGKGPQPVYQYIYGGYGIGIPPEHPSIPISLIDRGFTYVVSHVRGGDEKGVAWHDAGRLLNRKNSFADFEAISHYLVDKGYTTKGDISVTGESAGGMVTAVALNNEPGMYKSISILVPAFEILNKVLNPDLFISKIEWSEIGNPIESKEYFDYIKSYSPMQNLKKHDYPSFYVTGALQDKLVGYYEPLKWAIAVREHDTNPNPSTSLVHIRKGGHLASGDGSVNMDFAKSMTFLAVMHGKEKRLED